MADWLSHCTVLSSRPAGRTDDKSQRGWSVVALASCGDECVAKLHESSRFYVSVIGHAGTRFQESSCDDGFQFAWIPLERDSKMHKFMEPEKTSMGDGKTRPSKNRGNISPRRHLEHVTAAAAAATQRPRSAARRRLANPNRKKMKQSSPL